MFRSQTLWFTVAPPFTDEFAEWAKIAFPQGICSILDGKMVRSSRGAGNRGGWEYKPYWMIFHFTDDAEAIVFKMKWGHLAEPS